MFLLGLLDGSWSPSAGMGLVPVDRWMSFPDATEVGPFLPAPPQEVKEEHDVFISTLLSPKDP